MHALFFLKGSLLVTPDVPYSDAAVKRCCYYFVTTFVEPDSDYLRAMAPQSANFLACNGGLRVTLPNGGTDLSPFGKLSQSHRGRQSPKCLRLGRILRPLSRRSGPKKFFLGHHRWCSKAARIYRRIPLGFFR